MSDDNKQRKEVVFVLGGPGSGKGTQCARIASELGYVHLSTGDLLREEQKNDSALAKEIDECIRDGRLVPSETMVALLKEAILKGDADKFLLDGFPRSKDNLGAWFHVFSHDQVQVKMVLFLDCPKDALTKRLLERGKTSGRADDNIESVLKRFDTFEKESLPVVEQLDKLGMVRKVSTVPPKDVVFHRIRRLFRGCRLVDPVERTLALIKPDAVGSGKAEEIIKRAEEEGFVVVAKTEGKTWLRENAEEFYAEHKGKAFFDELVTFMSSGPLVELCLEKVGAVKAWRALAGPTKPENAKNSEPSSLRALHGTNGTKNAVHGSDSFASALREVTFCFSGETNAAGYVPVEGNGLDKEERTLAILKPGVSELHADDVLSALAFRGFQVLKTSTQVIIEAEAKRFFEDKKAESVFREMCASLTEGGETMALCLSRVKAVAAWQSLMGPSDPKLAKEKSPRSLRALYGEDPVNNAVYGSNSQDDAVRDMAFWFPERSSGGVSGEGPGEPVYSEMMSYLKEKVDPVIAPLLERVLKTRPKDVAEFAVQDLQQLSSRGGARDETKQAS